MEFFELPEFIQSVLKFISKSGYLRKSFYFDYLSPKSRSTKFRNWKIILDSRYVIPYNRSFIGEDVYKLSKRGKRILSNSGIEFVSAAHPLHFDHDDLAIQFALACQQSKIISPNWNLERTLRSRQKDNFHDSKLPDLTFEIPLIQNSLHAVLEVERTRKSKSRYDDFILGYRNVTDTDLILIAYKDESIRKHIQISAQRFQHPQDQRPLAFCKLSDLRENPTNFLMQFERSEIYFSQYIQNLHKLSASLHQNQPDPQSDGRSQL